MAAVANCEAADRFVNSASPHAAAQRSLTDLHQKPCKPGHVHRERSEVGTPGEGSPPSVPSWARGGLLPGQTAATTQSLSGAAHLTWP